MIRKPLIYLGMMMCAIALAMHLSGAMDFGNLVFGFAAVLVMFMIALTLAVAAERDQADG